MQNVKRLNVLPINYSNPVRAFPWELDKDDLWKDPAEYEAEELGCLCKQHVEEEISYVSELLGDQENEIETYGIRTEPCGRNQVCRGKRTV